MSYSGMKSVTAVKESDSKKDFRMPVALAIGLPSISIVMVLRADSWNGHGFHCETQCLGCLHVMKA